ncbi:MAG: hypothetical protein HN348_10630 [Proteobacteria bacterium]|jgi:hypothetical protein|nr:hypothetical protein [Pseudomonadota bacterium]
MPVRSLCPGGFAKPRGYFDPDAACQCDAACVDMDDCCRDLDQFCSFDTGQGTGGTGLVVVETGNSSVDTAEAPALCVDRCGEFAPNASCQCDPLCEDLGDCCRDYDYECVFDTAAGSHTGERYHQVSQRGGCTMIGSYELEDSLGATRLSNHRSHSKIGR